MALPQAVKKFFQLPSSYNNPLTMAVEALLQALQKTLLRVYKSLQISYPALRGHSRV